MTTTVGSAKRRRRARRWAGRIGRAAAAVAVLLLAATVGFGASTGAAALTRRPALFLLAGLLAAGTVGAAGLWLTFRATPRPRRIAATAASTGLFLAVAGGAVSVPLSDPGAGPPPVAGLRYWELDTGSRLAHVRLPGAAPARPTPVVVLHGGPGIPDMAGDAAFFGRLTDLGLDVHVYDQLGSGRSTRLADPTGYGIERDVTDLEHVRRAIGAERMVLIGHSYGGTLAAHYLAAHPDRVEQLILSSPGALDPADGSADRATAGLDTGTRLRSLAAALAPRALLGYVLTQVDPVAAHAYLGDGEADARNDTILSISEPALHCDPGQRRGPVRGSGFYAWQYPQSRSAPARPDVRPALQGLPTPTLVLKGECDYLSWRSTIDYRRVLPATTLLYLEGSGHNTYQDRPDEVLAAIRAFLTGGAPPEPPHMGQAPPEGYRGTP